MTCVALLRGINVAGSKPLPMSELRELCADLGCRDVRTYLQSGNVVCTPPVDPDVFAARLSAAIAGAWGYDVPVIVRTGPELRAVAAACPFGPVDPDVDGTKVLVAFLAAVPAADRIAALQERVRPSERFAASGREIHLHCPDGYGRSGLTNTILERVLGVTATTRNWKTLLRLVALSA